MNELRQIFESQKVVEKPWHRLAVRLHLEGWSNHDIGAELGKSVEDVAHIITSDLGKKEISKAIEEDRGVVKKILEAAGVDSIYRLIKLRDTAKNESVQYNAAKTLLEQGHGKPLARMQQVTDDVPDDPKEEADKLMKELKGA